MMAHMDEEQKQIRGVAKVVIKALKRGWGFITIGNFTTQTGLDEDRVKEILSFLKSANLLNYEYMPFGERKEEDIFNKNGGDELDKEGAISFFGLREENVPVGVFHMNNTTALTDFVNSEEAFNEALKVARYRIDLSYDAAKRTLSFKGKEEEIKRSQNQRALCEVIFSKPLGTQFTEDDFEFDDIPEEQDETRRTINIITQVNLKIERLTGIHQFIELKGGIISTR